MSDPESKLNVLHRFETLLGHDVFFVPCEWGTKKPLVTYVERPFEATKTEAYRALFDVQDVNVAVYLGKASGGLCAIDFDRDEDLSAFLTANPALGATTQSRGSRGGMLWVRLKGDFPESCTPSDKHFEWRADLPMLQLSLARSERKSKVLGLKSKVYNEGGPGRAVVIGAELGGARVCSSSAEEVS